MKYLTLFLFCFPVLVFSQGAATTLNFDGTNDYVSVGAIGSTHTIEFWVNANTANTINGTDAAQPLISFNGAVNDMYLWSNNAFGGVTNETITLGYAAASNQEKSYITTVLADGWNHIAFVSNGTIYNTAYVNGVSVTVSPYSLAAPNNAYALIPNITTLQIGGRTNNGSGGAAYYRGELDEMRFWSTQRTQTEIRDNMCKKLVGNETGLIGYYRFDNGSGTTLTDSKSSGTLRHGTLTNFALSGATSNWVTSGAAIGNTSVHTYPGSWAGVTLTLSSTANGSFQMNTIAGTVAPSGIQLYRVDGAPNTSAGISGLGNNNVYWGSYIINGTSPTYTGVYDYTNFNYIAPANEGSLVINNRSDNASTPWSNISATLNTTTNTLTKTAISSRLEFILSNPGAPLPIELIDFKAKCADKLVVLSWVTATETNNDFFTLERADNKMNWMPIKIIKGAGNSTSNLNYAITDSAVGSGNTYYRLKQTDYDGTFKYSAIIYITCDKAFTPGLMVSPNPNNGLFTIKNLQPNTTLEIINALGKIIVSLSVNQPQVTLDMPELRGGNYILRVINSQGIKNFKLLITK